MGVEFQITSGEKKKKQECWGKGTECCPLNLGSWPEHYGKENFKNTV